MTSRGQEMQPFFNLPDGGSMAVLGIGDGIAHVLKQHLCRTQKQPRPPEGHGQPTRGATRGCLHTGAAPLIYRKPTKKGHDMTTTIGHNKADVYSRPNARFDGDGQLEIRASAAGNCRRALWYEATGYEITNPKTEDTLTMLEAGNALEPVVLRAMERAGWEVTPADPQDPQQVSVQVGPNMVVTGHPDATGVMPLFGGEVVVEVKTRGPEAFKRWRTLGAERSHPASVAQAGFYTLGTFGELRDAVIATMDTGSRQWDYEVIPAARVETALERASEWLGQLGAHLVLNGPDPGALPDRDFSATDWQCKSCPFLAVCLPGRRRRPKGNPNPPRPPSLRRR